MALAKDPGLRGGVIDVDRKRPQRHHLVESDAGGLAEGCSVAGCNLEIWTCCPARGCSAGVCAVHFGSTACHQHNHMRTWQVCPCQDCQAERCRAIGIEDSDDDGVLDRGRVGGISSRLGSRRPPPRPRRPPPPPERQKRPLAAGPADRGVEEPRPRSPPRQSAHDDTWCRLFPQCLWIPGALHIVHSVCENLTTSLTDFEKGYLPQLRTLVSFLNEACMRQRFVATCLTGTGIVFTHLFLHGTLSLAEWRWGSLMECVGKITAVMLPLRVFWKSSSMVYQEQAGQEKETPAMRVSVAAAQFNIETIAAVISSSKFWAYSHMMLMLGQIVSELQGFFLACKCHPNEDHDSKELARNVGVRRRVPRKIVCPMMGRLAPEMATGEWKIRLNELLAISTANVLPHTAELTEEERGLVLRDFDQGKQRVVIMNLLAYRCSAGECMFYFVVFVVFRPLAHIKTYLVDPGWEFP